MKGTFNWDGFPKEKFEELKKEFLEKGIPEDGEYGETHDFSYEGAIRTGELCYDVVVRTDKNEHSLLTFDLYAGGIDTGYGYKGEKQNPDGTWTDGYPYDSVDGADFDTNWVNMTYEEFQKNAEADLVKYTDLFQKNYKDANLAELAEKPLHVW